MKTPMMARYVKMKNIRFRIIIRDRCGIIVREYNSGVMHARSRVVQCCRADLILRQMKIMGVRYRRQLMGLKISVYFCHLDIVIRNAPDLAGYGTAVLDCPLMSDYSGALVGFASVRRIIKLNRDVEIRVGIRVDGNGDIHGSCIQTGCNGPVIDLS